MSIIITAILVVKFVFKKKQTKQEYDSPKITPNYSGETSKIVNNLNENRTYAQIEYRESGGILGWMNCFPLRKGLNDNEDSEWIKNLQTYIGLEPDGCFGESTLSAVQDTINQDEVDWWQYRNLKEAYYRLNPNLSDSTIKTL